MDTGVHGSGEDDGGDWRGGSLPPPSHIFCLAAHQICVTNVTMAERGKGGPVWDGGGAVFGDSIR